MKIDSYKDEAALLRNVQRPKVLETLPRKSVLGTMLSVWRHTR